MRSTPCVMLLAAVVPPSVAAQHLAARFASFDPGLRTPAAYSVPVAPPRDPVDDPALLAMGGITGAALGMFAGGLVGMAVERAGDCDPEWCGLAGAVYGATVGEMFFLPLGAHLANRRRGNYDADLAVSLGVGLVGVLSSGYERGEVLIAAGLVQLVSVVLIEQSAARRREVP